MLSLISLFGACKLIARFICNGKSAIVDINSAKAKGKLAKREKKFVEVWAEIHRQELLDNWDLMIKENRVNNIEPLR